MKYIEIRKDWTKKLIGAAALGAFAFAPLVGAPGLAQSAPRDTRDTRDSRVDTTRVNRQTINGVVTGMTDGNSFTVRTDRGATVRVESQFAVRNLTRGDRVVLYGYTDNNVFVAESVRVTVDDAQGRIGERYPDDNYTNRDSNNRDYNKSDYYDDRTITGIVTRDLGGNNFEVRTDDGRLVTVRARNGEPTRLSRGDEVTLQGDFDRSRNMFVADSVNVLNESDVNGRALRGVVTRDLTGNIFEIRTDDGRTVRVRARNDEPTRLSRGDRVTVRGRYNQNRDEFVAHTVRIARDGNNNLPNNSSFSGVNFPGTVTSVDSATRLRVRGDNGRTYTINARTAGMIYNVRSGDRVRITGNVRNGEVLADSVSVFNRNNTSGRVEDRTKDNRNDNRVEFTGTVVVATWMGQQLTVRREDGKQFSITVPRGSGSFRNGDRVRVVGWKLNDGRIQATSITRF